MSFGFYLPLLSIELTQATFTSWKSWRSLPFGRWKKKLFFSYTLITFACWVIFLSYCLNKCCHRSHFLPPFFFLWRWVTYVMSFNGKKKALCVCYWKAILLSKTISEIVNVNKIKTADSPEQRIWNYFKVHKYKQQQQQLWKISWNTLLFISESKHWIINILVRKKSKKGVFTSVP